MEKGPGAPIKFITSLQTWLKASFGKRFKNFGNSLEHVVQNDSYSCGIITANTIAHTILGHPLCDNSCTANERIKWFIRFASLYQSKSVSATMNEDVDMPLAAREDLSNGLNQARKAVTRVIDLLNPIDPSDPSELATVSYDSDSSSDCDIPLQPKPKPTMSTLKSDNSGHKRTRPDSSTDSESNTESSDGYESSTNSLSSAEEKRKAKYVKAGEGTSRSATASRAMREKFRDGILKIQPWRVEAWKKKVLKDDPKAEFDPKDICHARHSGCGKYVKMKEPCNIGRWKDHIHACNKKSSKKPAAGTPTLFQLGWAKVTQAGKKKKKVCGDSSENECKPELDNVPCPGITVSDDPRVLQYLKRTGASGGGGRSLPVISKQLFKKLFNQLLKKVDRKVVIDTQMHEWKWKNDHVNHRVYAIACQQTVVDRSPKPPLPCSECGIILHSKVFKNAIQKPIPSDKNSRFINYRIRNPLLGSIYARTIGVREIVEDEVQF
jgi:hypothetical protein